MRSFTLVLFASCLVGAALAQGGGYKQPEGYFQYVNVPGHKEYEFGWNRGNPHHYISRFEQLKDHRFRTRVKWSDTHEGYGEHYWEYNHAPKYKETYKKAPAPSYHAPEPAYHAPAPGYHAPPPQKGYPSDIVPVSVSLDQPDSYAPPPQESYPSDVVQVVSLDQPESYAPPPQQRYPSDIPRVVSLDQPESYIPVPQQGYSVDNVPVAYEEN